MKCRIFIIITNVFFLVFGTLKSQVKTSNNDLIIVSFPDFFNFDVPEPWPQWDTSVNWFLTQVTFEKPDFILVAGDLVNGHWWDGPKCIEQMGANYYGNWKRRMDSHHLKYYVAVGDHDLGDDPWWAEKRALVPHFERIFAQHFNMPANGPDHKKGLAYYVRQQNALFVTVETFELVDTMIQMAVIGEQLNWFKRVLQDNQDADFIIVQGHVPVFGKPNVRSSSMLMLQDSTQSEFWKTMVKYGVDAYLCGEFHDVTIDERDGIWQIVHGSSWGRKIVNTMDYLVIKISQEQMTLTMKSFSMIAGGENMWNLHKDKGPMEIVTIPKDAVKNGPKVTGTLTINKKNGEKVIVQRQGVFLK